MPATAHTRLDSWKAIADYLDRDVTTAMRWARDSGLPVHRVPHPGGKRHVVFAYRHELDAWLNNGSQGASGLGAELQVPGVRGQVSGTRHSSLATRHYTLGLLGLAAILAFTYYLARPLPEPKVLGYSQITNDGRRKEGNVVTDGVRLYFVEDTGSGPVIVQVPTSGGEVQVVTTAFTKPSIQDLSLTRAEVLVSDPATSLERQSPLWALSLAGAAPRRVGNIFANAAGYSPNGDRIAYGTGADLYISNYDGSDPRKIATLPVRLAFIRWAPDGRSLRLTVDRPNLVDEIWEVRPDGSNPQRLFANWDNSESQSGAVWGLDGRHAFFCTLRNSEARVWAVSEAAGIFAARKSPPMPLSTGPLRFGDAVPSADARRVFLESQTSRAELLRLDTSSEQFAPFLAGLSAEMVDFSRDGSLLAHIASPDQTLWRRRADGSQAVQLTFPPMQVELPRWSPDGKWIAFLGRRDRAGLWQVFVIPAEGGEYKPVLPSQTPQGAPTWSQDGAKLAFGELIGAGRPARELVIHLVDLKTHQDTTLPGSTGLWTARWSPNGRYVAALTADSRALMLYDFRTEKWTKLAAAGSISDLNWTRQSDAIYFEDSLPPGGPGILRLRLRDRRVEKVASLKREPPIISSWLGLTPDGSVMVSNTVGSSEIYALDWEAP